MSRQQSLRNGASLMVLGALIFLVYAVVFLFRAFTSSGFELGVETLNGVTPQQLDGLNPAIMGYITHLHVAIAGFIAATAIAGVSDPSRCRRRNNPRSTPESSGNLPPFMQFLRSPQTNARV